MVIETSALILFKFQLFSFIFFVFWFSGCKLDYALLNIRITTFPSQSMHVWSTWFSLPSGMIQLQMTMRNTELPIYILLITG